MQEFRLLFSVLRSGLKDPGIQFSEARHAPNCPKDSAPGKMRQSIPARQKQRESLTKARHKVGGFLSGGGGEQPGASGYGGGLLCEGSMEPTLLDMCPSHTKTLMQLHV